MKPFRIVINLLRFGRLPAILLFFFSAFILLSGCENLEPERVVKIRTDAITSISSTSCQATATLLDPGMGQIEQHGFCWAETESPTIHINNVPLGPISSAGEYTGMITGLSENTVYYLRAYVQPGEEVIYGEQKSFMTLSGISLTPIAEFTASPTIITAGQSVQFTDQSANNPTSWGWTFGDGDTSTMQNPSHIYDNTGSYSVSLTAINSYGSDSEIKTSYITVENSGVVTGTVTDYDGNTYNTIKIGNQWWMVENLKTTHYANSTSIPLVESASGWENLDNTDEAYCYFDNSSANGNIYGALYTWGAAMHSQNSSDNNPSGVQGVCPTGWHLPGDTEWKQLEMELGMSQSEADNSGYRGTNEGSKLAGNAILWIAGDLGNDTAFGNSGFTALPGGFRDNYGMFHSLGAYALFWSTSENSSFYAWSRGLDYSDSEVRRYNDYKDIGYSVRCTKN